MQAGFTQLNPRLKNFFGAGFTIPRQSLEWKQSSSQPRRAILNNFGAAGSNGVLLLEDFVDHRRRDINESERTAYPFHISSLSQQALCESVQRYKRFLKYEAHQVLFRDICYSACARRRIFKHRVSFSCKSREDLLQKLENADIESLNVNYRSKSIVFVFSGQGSLYFGMGEELMKTAPLFRDVVIRCDALLQSCGLPGILKFLRKHGNDSNSMDEAEHVMGLQCACVVVEYALAKLWISWNVVPDIVLGHRQVSYPLLTLRVSS